jgi:chemotaxis signal transduction protein
LLILRHAEDRLALLVDSVEGIVPVAAAEVRPVGAVTFGDCVEGDFSAGERTVHLLAADRLLLEKERQCLAEFAAAEQQRLSSLEEAPA